MPAAARTRRGWFRAATFALVLTTACHPHEARSAVPAPAVAQADVQPPAPPDVTATLADPALVAAIHRRLDAVRALPARPAVLSGDPETSCGPVGALEGTWLSIQADLSAIPRDLGGSMSASTWPDDTVPEGLQPWIDRASAWLPRVLNDARCPAARGLLSIDRGALGDRERHVLQLTRLMEDGLVLRWRSRGDHQDLIDPWLSVAVLATDLARRGNQMGGVFSKIVREVWIRETIHQLLQGRYSTSERRSLASGLASVRRADVPVVDWLAGETAATAAGVLASAGASDLAPWGTSGSDTDSPVRRAGHDLGGPDGGTADTALRASLDDYLHVTDQQTAAFQAATGVAGGLDVAEGLLYGQPPGSESLTPVRAARMYLQTLAWTTGLQLALEALDDLCVHHPPPSVVRESDGIRARWTQDGGQSTLVVERTSGVPLPDLAEYHRELVAQTRDLCRRHGH